MTLYNFSQNAWLSNNYNGEEPEYGPRSLILQLDFTATGQYEIDLTDQLLSGKLDMIQTLWIDNKNNATPVQIDIPETGQHIKVAPRLQGYFPVLTGSNGSFVVSTTSFAGNVQIGFLTHEIAGASWLAQ